MSPNRLLAITFAAVAVFQTAVPIIGQKLTRAMVYEELFHAAIVVCVLAAIAVLLWQAISRRFSAIALTLFYVGLALLVAFDFLIIRATAATC